MTLTQVIHTMAAMTGNFPAAFAGTKPIIRVTHMSAALALVSTFLFLTATARGTEPFKPDVTGKINTVGADGGLDHLVPVQAAIPEYDYLAQYIEAVALYDEGNYLVVLRTKDGRYVIQTVRVPEEKLLSRPTKPDIEIQISESFASVIYDLWVNALLEVHYERKQHGGLDGETSIFSTFVVSLGWMHGSTWSPSRDLPPAWMVEAGKKLIAFARDEKRDAKAAEAELTTLRDKLFRYIKTHGKH